ncbi:cytochrome P450 [Mycena belliarum]|uniref:Cytochrome P450 n=1 Tax=Mycena belliarum TaxID=1033014 RepID=A0AAD6XRQ6_9AGAR|nr:cytochrome P450 [Mycena belliae]
MSPTLVLQVGLGLATVIYVFARIAHAQVATKSLVRGLPGPPKESYRFGHLRRLYDPNGMKWHHQLNRLYGGVAQINGTFGDEQLYVTDPLALHTICSREVENFEETSIFVKGNSLIFGNGLLSTTGEVHKKQRKMLNPIFSTSHMRDITPIFYTVVQHLVDLIATDVDNAAPLNSSFKPAATIDMLDMMMRTALEGVGQCGLGHSFGTLDANVEGSSSFRAALRNLIPTIFSLQVLRQAFLPIALKIGTPAFRKFLVDIVPSKRLHRLRDIVEVMRKTNADILEKKNAAFARGDRKVLEQVGHGRDIISVLLRAQDEYSVEDRMSPAEVLSHMTTLVFTSHDTTSSTMSHILYFLAQYPDVQDKLRKEIRSAKDAWYREHGTRNIDYDALSEQLPFLEMVIRETLRVDAPVSFMSRTAQRATVLPLANPIALADGRQVSEVPVAANQNIIIGIASVDRDPRFWGLDSDEWKPERWANGVPVCAAESKIPGIYAGQMSFLGGGRACIGYRFAHLEIKIVISMLLDQFAFEPIKTETVKWKLANIQMPWVEGKESQGPMMPMVVKRI